MLPFGGQPLEFNWILISIIIVYSLQYKQVMIKMHHALTSTPFFLPPSSVTTFSMLPIFKHLSRWVPDWCQPIVHNGRKYGEGRANIPRIVFFCPQIGRAMTMARCQSIQFSNWSRWKWTRDHHRAPPLTGQLTANDDDDQTVGQTVFPIQYEMNIIVGRAG